MRTAFITVLLLLVTVQGQIFKQCPQPQTPANFTLEKYSGLWYEIGKIQTAGGAFFERKCQCTRLDVTINNNEQDQDKRTAITSNICREGPKGGKVQVANATITPREEPGQFYQQFSWSGSPKVAYNIIYLDDDYSIEFDCYTSLGGLSRNYCIHILARTPQIPQDQFYSLLNIALKQGLNLDSLHQTMTLNDDCYNEETLIQQ